MLEFRNNPTTTIEDLKDFVTILYVLIDDLYNENIPEQIKRRRNKDKAILSDSEIITIAVTGEILSMDSEEAWIRFVSRNLRDLFPRMCERSRFNRVRRNLMSYINAISEKLKAYVHVCQEDQRIIDSFPLAVCKFGRAHFCKTFKGYGADYGYCPSKKETYYGYKVHVLCTLNGYVTDFIISPASVDDRAAVFELVESYHQPLVIIGDKGYVDHTLATELQEQHGITLLAMKRNNAKNQYPKPLRQLIFKLRRRIETSFSQLTVQFNMERVFAKSLWGLQSRIITKLLGFNLCCFINQLLGVHHIARIKSLVF